MKHIITISIAFTLLSSCFGQNQNNTWYFGVNAGIDFNVTPPVTLTNGALATTEGTSVVCDPTTGALLFYTDGVNVYNSTHALMPNGTGLWGHASSAQTLAVKQPGANTLYYIFCTPPEAGAPPSAPHDGFSYSIVDMSLNGGLGDVVAASKNTSVYQIATEKVIGVRHDNGTDVWIISHEWQTNNFYVQLLSSTGLSAPVISSVGSVITGGVMYDLITGDTNKHNSAGQMKASPDGSMLALAMKYFHEVLLYQFDNTTGSITNEIRVMIDTSHIVVSAIYTAHSPVMGVEFSLNSKKLYASTYGALASAVPAPKISSKLIQFDLCTYDSLTVGNSMTLVNEYFSFPAYNVVERGPNGKIYVSKANDFMDVVNEPNNTGAACNFVIDGMDLLGNTSSYSAVNYVAIPQPPTTAIAVVPSSGCAGDSILLSGNSSFDGNSWQWDFGDPGSGILNTSSDSTTGHVYSMDGSYTVTLDATSGCLADSVAQVVQIGGPQCTSSVVGKTTKGTEFWLAFGQNLVTTDLEIYITSDVATSGVVDIPQTGWNVPYTVGPSSTVTITVPVTNVVTGNQFIQDRGIRVVSDDPVSVMAASIWSLSSDATLVLPRSVLGTHYRVMNYDTTAGLFVVVALECNTTVQITPSNTTLAGSAGGVPFTVVLDSGQTYQVKATAVAGLIGSVVETLDNKPIAVFGGHNIAVIGNCMAGDHIMDQLYPTELWGTEYITNPLQSRTWDQIMILANTNGTDVTIDGGTPITLNAGDFIDTAVSAPIYISSTAPVAVSEFATGAACFNNSIGPYGDPFMVGLNPLSFTIDTTLFEALGTLGASTVHYVNIVAKTSGVPIMELDGSSISGMFTTVAGNGLYSYASTSITPGTHTLTGDSGFTAFTYGFANKVAYCYSLGNTNGDPVFYSGTGAVTTSVSADTSLCLGESYNLLATGGYSYVWDPSTGLSDDSIANPVVTVTATTAYAVYVDTGCDIDTLTVTITVNPCLAVSIDTAICIGDSVVLIASGAGSYSWVDTTDFSSVLSVDSFYKVSPAAATTYAVYSSTDTVYVSVAVDTLNNAGTNGTATLCDTGPPFLLMDSLGGNPDPNGVWTPSLAGGIFDPGTNTAANYEYVVSGIGYCPNDTAKVVVSLTTGPTPPPKAGFDTTYCLGDSIVDITAYQGPFGVYTWYADSMLTTGIGTDSALSPIGVLGTSIYYVTDSDGTCQTEAKSVTIIVNNCTSCPGNLALNPSFESVTAPPTTAGEHNLVNDWTNAAGGALASPDYFNVGGSGGAGLPTAFFGDIMPVTGDVIMGLTLMHGGAPDYREYIDAPLSAPLVPGQSYDISFFVSNGQHNGLAGGMGSNNIGVHLSVGQVVVAGTAPLGITPSVNYNTIFYDSTWQYMSFQYVPTTAVDHITIGNFFDDASTSSNIYSVVPSPLFDSYAYVVFDDICVTTSAMIVSNDVQICLGDSIELLASLGTSYNWADTSNFGTILDTDSAFMVTPIATTTYAVFNVVDTQYVTVTTVSCPVGCPGNLVPNPGFEFYSALPPSLGLIYLANDWDNSGGTGTPDLLHINGTPGGSGLPVSYMGTINPYSGDGVAGGYLFSSSGTSSNYREYLDAQLSAPLVLGQTYDVSFYVTNGVCNGIVGGLGSNNIGVHFSIGALTQVGTAPLGITPTWNYSTIFYDPNWQQLTFQFTPTTAVDHITIGNFYNDASTLWAVQVPVTTWEGAYVAYDDFCIMPISVPLLAEGDTIICLGDSVELLASNGISYAWVDSADFPTLLHLDSAYTVSPLTTTTYAVYDGLDTAYLTVSVTLPPDAGIDGIAQLCTSSGTINLFDSLGGVPGTSGVWSPGLVSGTGIFDPLQDAAVTYEYIVLGLGGCPNDTAEITVTVYPEVNAGAGGTINLCNTDATIELFDSLTGSPDSGGSWSPAMVSGSGVFDPSIDPSNIYTYTVNGGACGNETAYLTVSVTLPPDAGIDGIAQLCTSSGTINLFDSLGGVPGTSGVWSPGLVSGTGIFDPLQDAAVTYEYVVLGLGGCPNDTAEITVTVYPEVNAGVGGTINLCNTDATIELFDSLTGVPDNSGFWLPSLTGDSLGTFDPATDLSGNYVYTVSGVSNCPSSSSTVTVNVSNPVNGGSGSSIALCARDESQDLIINVTGNPDSGGSWSPAMVSGSGVFDPSIDPSNIYTYTVNGDACGNETASVTVTVSPSILANIGVTDDKCNEGAGSILVTPLDGTAPYTYIWSTGEVENPISELYEGNYFVTINDGNGCLAIYDTTLVNSFLDCGYHAYVPNAFTPNGDQENDILYLRGYGISEFTLTIYNRWGNKVFETTDMSNGWDGVYRNQEQTSGVFVYYLIGEFMDGTSFNHQGNVSIVR
jgi:gliding motility-associated-like protein